MARITTLAEDAAEISAARAKRMQVFDGLTSASAFCLTTNIGTEDLFAALAEGREQDDPDYWTFNILKYLYKYMPFGSYGRWFVPVILGYGILCALSQAVDLIGKAYGALQTTSWFKDLKATLGFDHSGRIAFDAGDISGSFDPQMVSAGLLAVMPPYAATIVSSHFKATNGGRTGDNSKLVAELRKCQSDAQKLAAALAQNGVDPNAVVAGSMPSYSGLEESYATGVATYPTFATGYTPTRPTYPQPVVQQPQQPSFGEQVLIGAAPGIGQAIGGWASGWLDPNGNGSIWSDNVIRDRVVRDMNGPTELGMRPTGRRANY